MDVVPPATSAESGVEEQIEPPPPPKRRVRVYWSDRNGRKKNFVVNANAVTYRDTESTLGFVRPLGRGPPNQLNKLGPHSRKQFPPNTAEAVLISAGEAYRLYQEGLERKRQNTLVRKLENYLTCLLCNLNSLLC